MLPFDPDVVRIEVVSFSQLDAVPLEALEEGLRESEVAVVRVEDVDLRDTETGPLLHLPRQARDRALVLLQGCHGAAAAAGILRMVQDVDRFLPQVLRPLGGCENESR